MTPIPAPYEHRFLVGLRENYFIHNGYQCNLDAAPFDDTRFTDEFQREVYQYARHVLDSNKLRKVVDVGCGSGFKLITNFFDCETLGIDRAETAHYCRMKWRPRRFDAVDFFNPPVFDAQLVICSDVIEHVVEPDALLDYIRKMNPRRIVLSTPAREQLCMGTDNGIPRNPHHVREWSTAEFHAYIGSQFVIKEHFVQNTVQIVECALS